MIFEDFKKLVETPKPYVGDVFYRLDVFSISGHCIKEVCKYPAFDVWLSHSSFHRSSAEAEAFLKKIMNGKHSDNIYCVYVYKLPFGKNALPGDFVEAFAYDGAGLLVDKSYCSNLGEDYGKEHSVFRGRTIDAMRFDEGDFVEVFDCLEMKVRLAIVLRKVLSVEKCWNFYLEMKERVETDWKMPYELDCMIGHLDFTDDTYVVIDSVEREEVDFNYHAHANSIYLFKTRFPIPCDLKDFLLECYHVKLKK